MSESTGPVDGGFEPDPALMPAETGSRRIPDFFGRPADLPDGWLPVVDQGFDEMPVGVWGDLAAGMQGWRPMREAWGSSASALGAVVWEQGGGLESVESGLRIHTAREGDPPEWRTDGVVQDAAGVGQFHLRLRFRCSSAALRGIGFYAGLKPADGGWGSEWALLETPGGTGEICATTIHSDQTGRRNLALFGGRPSRVEIPCALAEWHTIEARRTFRSVGGQTLATCRYWLDGTECGGDDGLWIDNPFNTEPLIFTAFGFVARAGVITYGGAPDETTAADNFLEIDLIQIWSPA